MSFRDDLDQARDATLRLGEVMRELEFGPTRHATPGHSTSPGDPTLRAVERREALIAESEELERVIGDVGAVVVGCREVWSKLAYAVELHWLGIDGTPLTWRDVGAELGVSASTAMSWANVVVEWVDSVGVANARLGRGTAEPR